jgi:hypothetical protein
VIRNRGDYWQVRVYAGLDPLTGKKRFEYGKAPTQRQAEKLEAKLVTQVADGRRKTTTAKTVGELVERWLEWRQGVRPISPSTEVSYRHWIKRVIVPAFGKVPLRRLDVSTLDSFYAELSRRGRKDGKPLSPSASATSMRSCRARCSRRWSGAGALTTRPGWPPFRPSVRPR